MEELKAKLKELIHKTKYVKTILETLDIEEYQLLGLLELLKQDGFLTTIEKNKIKIITGIKENDKYVVPDKRDFYKFLFISDTHLASKYDRLDILNYIYEKAEKKEVDAIFHSGDFTDGKSNRPEHIYELKEHSYTGQKDYCIDKYPKSDIKTYLISGNHDLWWYKSTGSDIVADICKEREDLVYLGSEYGDIQFGQLNIRLVHGNKGIPYSLSYHLQRYIEGISSKDNIHIVARGHSHNSFFMNYQNKYALQVPAVIDQTPYGKSLGINTQRGCWWVEAECYGKGKPAIINPTLETFGDKVLRKRR